MLARIRRWLCTGEEISPWVGLSFGALCLLGIAAALAAAIYVQHADLSRQRTAAAAQWADWLARYIGVLRKESPDLALAEIRRATREDNITWCGVVSPEGVFTAHSDPAQIGRPAKALVAIDATAGGVQIAADSPNGDPSVLACKLPSTPGQRPEELRVGFAPAALGWARSEMLIWGGYIAPVVMLLFLACYRFLRRSVEPLAAIRRRLIGCQGQPAADRLLSLRMNDSFDQVAGSWNQLIDFVAQMQEQLRRSRLNSDVTAAMDGFRSERLTGILMQLPFGVMVVEADGTVSFANRAAGGMLSASGENLEGKQVESLLDESLRLSLLSGDSGARSASAARWLDHTMRRPHGEVTLRFWSVASEMGGEHTLFLQDITQTREAERARDQFLYHVTHELRTPLTNIRAYAETLSEGVIDDPQTIRECYNVIMGETQRLGRLVEDILHVSQLEVGTARLNVSEVQMDQLLRRVVQDMQGTADAKSIDLVLSLPAKLPRVRGDRDRLTVVLVNLIGNAVKYTPEGGRVEVTCAPENDRLRVNVTDTGLGIDLADQEKIFDKFYRVNDERVQSIPGTGLGLAIVKETVRLHGGGIFVNSTLGRGSTFSVVLPAMPLDASAGPATAVATEGK